MRRRGLVILLASLPTWIAAYVVGHKFWKENQAWGGDLATPPYVSAVSSVAIASAVLACCLLLFDFILWRRKRNDRNNQTG
jgi:hypothetical protein